MNKEVLESKKVECEKKFKELNDKLVEIDNARKTVEQELFRLQGEHRGYDALIKSVTEGNGDSRDSSSKILDSKNRVAERT